MIKATSRDNARTPMQWNDGPNAGFTAGKPWLGINRNYTRTNMESQVNDPCSVRSFYKAMIRLRAENDILKFGKFVPLKTEKHIFAYKRVLNGRELTILLNFSARARKVKFIGAGRIIISNYGSEKYTGILKPYEAVILE